MQFWVHMGRGSLAAVAMMAVVGCSSSGGDVSGGDRSGGAAGSQFTADQAGQQANAGSMTATGMDFGNTTTTAPEVMPPPVDPDTQCEEGKFCEALSPDEGCGSLALEPDVEITTTPGNVLVIFDVSLSMADAWGSTTKIGAASNALIQAVTPLQDSLTLGAIFFPTFLCLGLAPPGGGVEPIEGPTQLPFQPGPQFIQAWQAKFGPNPTATGGGTPLNEAFDRADVALQNASLTGNIAVVAFTDGEPTCLPDPSLTGIPTEPEENHAYDWLTMNNIKTYMVGLPGGQGVQKLSDIAMYGGTGDYLVPDDPAVLEEQLRMIVEETVTQGFNSCSINLDPPAEAPEKLHVVVDEAGNKSDVPKVLGTEDAWTISDDGSHVELLGSFCDAAQAGTYNEIKFEFGCVDLPPLPPIIVD